MGSRLRIVACCALTVALGACAAAPSSRPLAISSCDGSWHIVDSPSPGGTLDQLSAVAASSQSDIWAVGSTQVDGVLRTLIEHWDGEGWTVVDSPNAGEGDNMLAAVTVISADDVWAVGNSLDVNGIAVTLAEHWDGSSWSIVESANSGDGDNVLTGVAGAASDDVSGVGRDTGETGRFENLIERWDGTSWSVVESPTEELQASELFAVIALSSTDVWVVGRAGQAYGDDLHPFTAHWDGQNWAAIPTETQPSASFASSVTAVSGSDIWIVGADGNFDPATTSGTAAQHWDGAQWTRVLVPNETDSRLASVIAENTSDVWTVGYQVAGDPLDKQTLAVHWDGSEWTSAPTENASAEANVLSGVTAADGSFWSVGSFQDGDTTGTLVEELCS